MEPLCKYIHQCEEKMNANEDELIRILSDCLNNGGDIDFVFPQYDEDQGASRGTILHYAIINEFERVVEYALSRGADILVERIWEMDYLRHRNALETAILSESDSIAEMLKKRSFELYSSFGLTTLHLDCAFDNLNSETELYVESGQVNVAVSTESPLWPGMTPLLIAAKFEKEDLVKRLLDLGADPMARDPQGNTPLHYVWEYASFCERLFSPDARDTFGPFCGDSHFHIACVYGREALGIVKRYLDQGISPDLPTQSLDCESDLPTGQVGLHFAAYNGCSGLVRLLLEHGADIHKQDSRGDSPIECYFRKWSSIHPEHIECVCSFIEGGSNMEKVTMSHLLGGIRDFSFPKKEVLLGCIKKLTTLNEGIVSKNLMDAYAKVLKKCGGWNETEYVGRCLNELTTLSHHGLRKILDDTIFVKGNLKAEVESLLDTFDFNAYPIYGSLLKIKMKRRLLEFEKKKNKIVPNVSQIQKLFQSFCQLRAFPYLCAENILWNFSHKELDQFEAQFTTENKDINQ